MTSMVGEYQRGKVDGQTDPTAGSMDQPLDRTTCINEFSPSHPKKIV